MVNKVVKAYTASKARTPKRTTGGRIQDVTNRCVGSKVPEYGVVIRLPIDMSGMTLPWRAVSGWVLVSGVNVSEPPRMKHRQAVVRPRIADRAKKAVGDDDADDDDGAAAFCCEAAKNSSPGKSPRLSWSLNEAVFADEAHVQHTLPVDAPQAAH